MRHCLVILFLLTLHTYRHYYKYKFAYLCVYLPCVRWDWSRARRHQGDRQWVCTVPKAIIPIFPSQSLQPLLLDTLCTWLTCGCSKVHWDWPLFSLAAAFLTSGNTEKPAKCFNGSGGDFQLAMQCHTNSKAAKCSWPCSGLQMLWGEPASNPRGYLGWHK